MEPVSSMLSTAAKEQLAGELVAAPATALS